MKIIASDYDGTLSYGGIDDKKREAIKKWREAGNIFTIVSGRGPADALEILEKEKLIIDYFVANNGAIILNSDNERVSDIRCNGDIAVPLLELLFECGCRRCHVQTDFPCFVYADRKDCTGNDDYTLENVPPIPFFNQISTAQPTVEESEKTAEIVKEKFGEYVNPLQNGECLDIIRADMDKAKGIYNLLGILNAEKDDVIAVIKEFRSYAMNNGVDLIKKLADGTVSGITELIDKEI